MVLRVILGGTPCGIIAAINILVLFATGYINIPLPHFMGPVRFVIVSPQ